MRTPSKVTERCTIYSASSLTKFTKSKESKFFSTDSVHTLANVRGHQYSCLQIITAQHLISLTVYPSALEQAFDFHSKENGHMDFRLRNADRGLLCNQT